MLLSLRMCALSDAPGSRNDDAVLVREFLASRDPAPFRHLVDRYKDRVFRLVVSTLGPGREAEAEEVAQEVFVTVFRELPKFRMESRFGTWLYRIAYNRAIDCKRTPRLCREHCSDDVLAVLPADGERANPFAAAAESERRRAVAAALDELPDMYRSVLNLYYWMEHSIAEIAELLGVSEGTVKSYLHRARQTLEAHLRKRGLTHG